MGLGKGPLYLRTACEQLLWPDHPKSQTLSAQSSDAACFYKAAWRHEYSYVRMLRAEERESRWLVAAGLLARCQEAFAKSSTSSRNVCYVTYNTRLGSTARHSCHIIGPTPPKVLKAVPWANFNKIGPLRLDVPTCSSQVKAAVMAGRDINFFPHKNWHQTNLPWYKVVIR